MGFQSYFRKRKIEAFVTGLVKAHIMYRVQSTMRFLFLHPRISTIYVQGTVGPDFSPSLLVETVEEF